MAKLIITPFKQDFIFVILMFKCGGGRVVELGPQL